MAPLSNGLLEGFVIGENRIACEGRSKSTRRLRTMAHHTACLVEHLASPGIADWRRSWMRRHSRISRIRLGRARAKKPYE
jgi:hypothetical protein